MRVLTINCGSSTLKFDVFELAPAEGELRRLAQGLVDRIGGESSILFSAGGDAGEPQPRRVEGHAGAVRVAIEALDQAGLLGGTEAVGHRVVHGGARFSAPTLVDDDVIAGIERATELAPLHNQPALEALRAARELLGGTTMVAAFDTAFFAGLPAVASTYALPRALLERYSIRRYGFHGLAHAAMVETFRAQRPDLAAPRLISFQLGNGCSVTASRDGKALDTSMGFTPLEGLVMGTRSGDLDPALPLYIAEKEGRQPDAVESLLNRESGLLALSGRSNDMRDVSRAAAAGDPAARLALELFCYRARKYLGAYLAVLGGADGIIFGGGIGENSAEVRELVCRGMAWAGIELDAARNADPWRNGGRISSDASAVDVRVVRVDEAEQIARDTARVVSGVA